MNTGAIYTKGDKLVYDHAWTGGDLVKVRARHWETDEFWIYENMDTLLTELVKTPSNFGIDGVIESITENETDWLDINYKPEDCGCLYNDEGDKVKDSCDTAHWSEQIWFKRIEIVWGIK
jgi:hypothetical protein